MAQGRPSDYGKRKRKKEKGNKIHIFAKGNFYDYTLLFVVLFLVAFGLVMVYSTSSYTAELKMGTPTYYLFRQGIFAMLGIIAMFVIASLDYHLLKYFSLILIWGTIILLGLVLLIGKASNGSVRWIQIGSIQFQPSEVAKITITLFTAHMASIWAARIGRLNIMLKVLVLPLVAVALIALENLSTGIICAAIAFMIVFVTSPKVKEFILLGLGGVALMGIFLFSQRYRLERLEIWLEPEKHERGYQTLQSLYAVGSGGIFGKGLGQSIQKLGFIPESHNDYVFSVVCEELGLFGAICVVMLFVLLIWRCVMIAMSAPDLYGSLIVVGVITHIAVQVIVNIAVVTNTFPPTGVPLPFISYGGTAIACLLAEMGLVLSVARQIPMPKEY